MCFFSQKGYSDYALMKLITKSIFKLALEEVTDAQKIFKKLSCQTQTVEIISADAVEKQDESGGPVCPVRRPSKGMQDSGLQCCQIFFSLDLGGNSKTWQHCKCLGHSPWGEVSTS